MINNLWFAVVIVAIQLLTSLANPVIASDEEAPYTVIRKAEEYEIRSYAPAKWVCYDHVGPEFAVRQQANSFFALFDYINGENSQGVEINMTAPTTVRTVLSAETQGSDKLFQMCLYLPEIHQDSPPQPLENEVFIQNRPKLTVAARQFESYKMKSTAWEVQLDFLLNDLRQANEPNMDFDDFYGAAFDPPFKQNGRPNEVWVVKKD